MNHVLEHVADPKGYLQTINRLPSNDGHFAISVPNTESINAWLFTKFWYGLDVPRHVINYNPANSKKIFQKNGFKIKNLKHQQAGTFLLSLQFLINSKFNLNLKLIDNPLLFLLFFPVDILFNFMRRGDVISGVAVKQ